MKKQDTSSAKLWAKRARKQAEAFRRQSKYNLMSLAQKVEMIKGRRGENKRELARLTLDKKKQKV